MPSLLLSILSGFSSSMNKPKILVLCTGNSCRSQIAEGYLRLFAGDKAQIFSAGIEAHGLNPKAIATMAADGVDITQHTSDTIEAYEGLDFEIVLSVCDNAAERCPIFPSTARRLHHNFTDPAKAVGTQAEVMEAFANVRDEIKAYCKALVQNELS
jgi:arsenate reductase